MNITQSLALTDTQRATLVEARTKLGMSQAALAKAAGISQPMMAMLESGAKPAPLALITSIASLLGFEFTAEIATKLKRKKSAKKS